MKLVIELTRDELSALMAVLEGSLSKETEILHKTVGQPEYGVFDCTLASINRKAELYDKLIEAMNRRGG